MYLLRNKKDVSIFQMSIAMYKRMLGVLFQNGAGFLHFVDCRSFIHENKRTRKPSHTKLVLQEGMSIYTLYINTK